MPWGQAAKAPECGATRKQHRWSRLMNRQCETVQNAHRPYQDCRLRRIERKYTAFEEVPG